MVTASSRLRGAKLASSGLAENASVQSGRCGVARKRAGRPKPTPASGVDTELVDSLKALDPERPIREADVGNCEARLGVIVEAPAPCF